AHALLRSAALIVLGMLLPVPRHSPAEELLPYLLLTTGLPWARWVTRWTGTTSPARDRLLDLVIPALVVAAIATWLTSDIERLGPYASAHISTQLGLAYLPAFLLMGHGLRAPALAAAAILVLWGLLFIGFQPPTGVEVHGQAMSGLFANWNNGTNLAAAFDRWLFTTLPRSVASAGSAHGDPTREFVPIAASPLIGVVPGRLILRRPEHLALRLAVFGAVAVLLGSTLVWLGIFPLVKNLWTPSW